MSKPLHTSNFLKSQYEDKEKQTQLQSIFSFFENNIPTASMVAEKISRYKRDLEKKGVLWETEKKPCLITGHKVWYICVNQNLI